MLKRLLSVFTLAALIFVVVRIASPFNQNPRSKPAAKARQRTVVVKRSAGIIPKKGNMSLKQNHLKLTGNEVVSHQNFQILSKAATLTGPGTLIGRTAYNYQTNDNLHDRIIWNPANNTIHAEWMYGDIAAAPGFAGRRMRYNYFDGTNWYRDQAGAPTFGIPIESERSGYGSMAIDANNIAIPVSHVTALGNEGVLAWLDFQPGFGFFSPLKVHRKLDNTQTRLEPLWPDIAVDRPGNFHVIAINNNQSNDAVVLNDVTQNILYWKSTNRGTSWGNYRVLFPDTTMYPLTFNRAGNSQIAVSDIDNRKVGILITSGYHTLYFFESDDDGDDWKPGVNITGKPRLGQDPESFTLHPQQFDIVVIDSSNVGGPKYFDWIEWPATNTGSFYNEFGPIDSRPPAPADLIYINGEPHAVWNEVLSIQDAWYPAGIGGYGFTDPAHVTFLKGSTRSAEGGFLLKHWSPSTGVTMIARYNESPDAYAGTFSQWLTQPQLGRDASGNLYCVYTLHDDSDTLQVQGQRETRWGPLSFGEIWGAKSTDNGAIWSEAVRLTQTFHESERYVGISDLNPNDVIHLIYQTANTPGTAVGAEDSRDHPNFVTAEIRHWAVPTSLFPSTSRAADPEIELSEGVLDFLNTPGTATRSFTISNVGNADLVIDGAFVADIGAPDPVAANDFTINPSSFTVPAKGTQRVDVTYKASTTRRDTLLLAIPNNDLSEGSRGLVILASATITSVASGDVGSTPSQYALAQNYPNPISLGGVSKLVSSFATEIRYGLKASGHAKIRIFDMLGREVAVLVDGIKSAGEHRITWQPNSLTAGIYFYSLEVNGFRETRKMVLLP